MAAGGGLDRRLGEKRAAEIGVQHRAGEIEDRPQARSRFRFEPAQGVGGQRVALVSGRARSARFRGQRLAHRGDRSGAAEPFDGERRRLGSRSTSSTEGKSAQTKIGLGGHGVSQ